MKEVLKGKSMLSVAKETGLSYTTVYKLFTGKPVRVKTIQIVAEHLNLSATEILKLLGGAK